MRRLARFVVALACGLALLTWVASLLVQRTTRGWFERDLGLRAQLAANGARRSLLPRWHRGAQHELEATLTEITQDERIMAVAACTRDREMLARTAAFPEALRCADFAGRVLPAAGSGWRSWASIEPLDDKDVHVSAVPVDYRQDAPGFLIVVQDLSFIERREWTTRQFLIGAFVFLALAAGVVATIASRLSWRRWSEDLRKLLRGEAQAPEFQPLLRDVRDLVEQIVAERESEEARGAWTAERLRQTLDRHLHGEKVILLANREPYLHERRGDDVVVVHPASGLVSAVEPVMRACAGTWVAHGSGSADRQAVDEHDRLGVPPGEESYWLRRVWLTAEEERGYYYGFSNEGLWPLCHLAHHRPTFRAEDWRQYKAVNARFADAVAEEAAASEPIVLVQDYHFGLAPSLIRERNADATILMFWHIPWPSAQHFGICPWRKDILQGMLGADILGFHTQFDCNNFLDAVDRFLEARIDRERNAVIQRGHSTLVRPYPISIEWPARWLEGMPSAPECRAAVLQELGLGPEVRLGVGVDRLDYTKGIEERLLAVERLLERAPEHRGRLSFVQLAAPSRTVIERYRELNQSVEDVAARINGRFGSGSYRPVILLRAHHEPPQVFKYLRAADFCYVSSLHDGMNLVAKEFVAARDDDRGVLILSQFTGAARELTEALVVNPYDLEEASAAIERALSMTQEEQRLRMRAMRGLVSEFNVYRWAGRMLEDAARLRSRERLTGRLARRFAVAADAGRVEPAR